ncbi:hypothetical protein C9374_005918 [Naegleria lovaniensis]|uniref:RasGEF domain-containing protein n=1 Tax=Naegleria lovaniensis TaxID=51637 RepID=A0AA88GJG6_NAELO|nr:uncharacterized protein C9374_005918 [Naegleria lovaniensis]KAG2382126.1 hypothetical protein C9374_005918 [Naegleria lovaniensis]
MSSSSSNSSLTSTLKSGWKNLTGGGGNNKSSSNSTSSTPTIGSAVNTQNELYSSASSPPLDQMSVKQLVEKINVLQVQLFMVTKEKQQLAYQNSLLQKENLELQQLLKRQASNTVKTNTEQEKKIESLISKFEKVSESMYTRQASSGNISKSHSLVQDDKKKQHEEETVYPSSEDDDDDDTSSSTTLSSSNSSFNFRSDDLSSTSSHDHLGDMDNLIVQAKNRKTRLPSVFRKPTVAPSNSFSEKKLSTNNSSSSNLLLFNTTSETSVAAANTSSSSSGTSTTPNVENKAIKEKAKTTNGTLIIEYPVNPIFSKSQQSTPGGKRVTKGAKVSVIQIDDMFAEPVQGFVVGNDSRLSCEGDRNAAAKIAVERFSQDILQQCREYIQNEKQGKELNEGEVFCSTFMKPQSVSGSFSNLTSSSFHLIHINTGNAASQVASSKSNDELDGANLDSNELTKTKFYNSLSNAVHNALECIDTLECQSIAYAPFLYRTSKSEVIPQYGLTKSQWLAAARCFFRSTFEHCIENRLSSTLLDIRFIVTTEEEAKILKHHLDIDFQFFIFNFVKLQAQFSRPTSSLASTVIAPQPKNIEWMDSTDEESDQAMEIKCATLHKLIERVTYHKNYDNAYLYAFLLTYRSFTTPHDLMDKLIARYNLPPPNAKTITKSEFTKWQEEVLQQVRLRVTQVVKFWIENHYHDFENDSELLEKVKKLSTIMENTQGKHFATQLLNSIKRQQSLNNNNVEVFVKIETAVKYPKKYRPGKDDLSKFDILEWPSSEIARQITLIEYNMFKAIKPKECLNQSWNKESREQKAFNIYQMITWFNRVSKWVASRIMSEPNIKDRKAIMTKMIQIADECRKLNNFNAVFEFVSGLQNSAVHRLKKTWELLKSESKRDHDELLSLISGDNNFRAIRHAILYVKPPCIPYIGVTLTDLTFIEDGNPNILNDKINFIKRRKLALLIRDIQTYQQTPYSLQSVPELQERLKAITSIDDEKLFKLSLEFEPRQQKTTNV